MISFVEVILIIVSYVLGSIPSAVLVGKSFHGLDVRLHGSMSAGATNTFRVLGKRAGITVLIMDILKGATAVNLVYFSESILPEYIIGFKILFGLMAVVGHIYPLFASFKGGKGIATLLGMVIAIDPILALGCISIFLIILISTNMVSLGSILSTLSFGIMTYIRYGFSEPFLLIFGIFAGILVLYTHRANIGRIMRGEEKKIYLFKKK